MHWRSNDAGRNQREVRGTLQALRNLRTDMLDLEERLSSRTQKLAPGQRHSARNLIHYLALRAHDLRKLQKNLAEIGVSSLGRSEGQAGAKNEQVRIATLFSQSAPNTGRPAASGVIYECIRQRTSSVPSRGAQKDRLIW